MNFTQLRIRLVYRDKLKQLAELQNRSMANMLEVLIDKELSNKPTKEVNK